jgi:HlyD family secretion protein
MGRFGYALAAMAMMASAAAWSNEAAPARPAPQAALPAITVTTVARATIADRVRASGLIGPVERVFVQPEIEGQAIDSVEADVGDTVETGQVLARLSDASLNLQKVQIEANRASAEAAIAQAEAQLTEAESNAAEAVRVRDRSVTLSQQGTLSKSSADEAAAAADAALARVTSARQGLRSAQAQLRLVEAQLDDIALQLARTEVKAPFGGTIVERNAQLGAIASAAGESMFVIVRAGLLELNADIAEQDLLRLQAGQTATLRAVGLRQPLTGKIRLVEPTVDTVSRLGRARIEIDDSTAVRSGMFAEADILVTERDTVVVPVSAINTDAAGSFALKVTDGQVARADVETGIREGNLVEVVAGLVEGDQIVLKAGAFVRPGDRINPVPDTQNVSN